MLSEVEQDVTITKEFIHTRPWRRTVDRLQKWQGYMTQICQAHNATVPTLTMQRGTPHYIPTPPQVFINKFSIISLLHELGHHFYGGMDQEDRCREYSESVFLAAYPPARPGDDHQGLVRDERGYLVPPPDGTETKLYFAYGANLLPPIMTSRCSGIKPITRAKLNGFRIEFRGTSRNWDGGAVATLVEDTGAHVDGALYEVPCHCLYYLDQAEGAPARYERRNVTAIKPDNTEASAFIYQKIDEDEPGEPNATYIGIINVGRAHWGIEPL